MSSFGYKLAVLILGLALVVHLLPPPTIDAGAASANLYIPVPVGAKVLSLSFNGPGRPVILMETTGGIRGIQYQDSNNDGDYEPAYTYVIIRK